uniref:Polygalacturonase inhibitor-like n=1 Tax=Elaeis guineensis var. tenera TaxID=51953 RepID=A0A6I9SIT9_ELAGV|nr:polygalacturonase inhibitor-like [Elaeis guineensis]
MLFPGISITTTGFKLLPHKMPSTLPLSYFFSLFLLVSLFSGPLPVSSARCHKDDKKALLAVKSGLGNPYDLIAWTSDYPCCDWAGVSCDSATGRVTSLDISGTNSSATIPTSVADLPFLQSLTFHKNANLTGPIPSAIATLTRLTFLRLDWNGLSGPVPAFLARLTALDYLNLAFNQFSGSIPPSLGSLPLEFLRLDRNRLTGPIPSSLSRSSLTYLYLSHNGLTGSIPQSFANAQFEVLDLSRNQLAGDASLLFGTSKPLQVLDLSRNQFEFDFSAVEFPENMTALDLNHNQVYGSIPPEITQREWQLLNVSYNRLCGQIPSGGNLGRFDEYSFFHNKCLCGPPLAPCK